MAWSDVLQNLMGMQQLSQNRAEASRGRRLQYDAMANATREQSRRDRQDMFSRLGSSLANAGISTAQSMFQAAEAEKDRALTKDRLTSEEERHREQRGDYIYKNKEFPLPGNNAPLVMSSTNPVDHEKNMKIYDALMDQYGKMDEREWQMELARYRQSLADSGEEGTSRESQATEYLWTQIYNDPDGQGILFDGNQKIYGFDPNNEMSIEERQEEWRRRFNEIYGPKMDDWITLAFRDAGIEDTPESRRLFKNLLMRSIEETPPDSVTPEPEDGGKGGRSQYGALLSEEGAKRIVDFVTGIPGAVRGAVTETPEERQQTIEEIDNSDITGMGLPFDIARTLQNIQAEPTQDVRGGQEQTILELIAQLDQMISSPEDKKALQDAYDKIAAEGFYGGRLNRSARQGIIDKLTEMLR